MMKSSSSSRAGGGGADAGSFSQVSDHQSCISSGLSSPSSGSVRCGQTHDRHTTATTATQPHSHNNNNNNNNNTIWGGSVLTGEEPPPHSGELKHALPQAGGPTQSQLSRPMSSGNHISMEHRLRRKQLNSDTDASN